DAVEVVGLHEARGQRGGDNPHGVVATGEAAEGVVAVAAGGRGGDDVVGGFEQLDGDAVDTRLTVILDAVAVAVVPDAVADGTVETVSEVDVGAVLAGGEGERRLV